MKLTKVNSLSPTSSNKTNKIGTMFLSLLPTSEATLPIVSKAIPLTTVAVGTLLTTGCSLSIGSYDQKLVNKKANKRAFYHLELANTYYDLVSAVVKDIEQYNLDPDEKKNLLNWYTKVEVRRRDLLSAFNTKDINDVLVKIETMGQSRPMDQQERAHYYYRQAARQAYFRGLISPQFNIYHGDNTVHEPFKTFVKTVNVIDSHDGPTWDALNSSLGFHDSTRHAPVPWGFSVLGNSEFYDFGIDPDGTTVNFGENQPTKEELKYYGRK